MNMMNIGRVSMNSALQPLTDEEIAKIAPSVFAGTPHASRSKRYTYISSVDLLNGLRKKGFEPFSAMQNKARKEGKKGFVKHLIRFRHKDHNPEKLEVSTAIPEVVLINSHDGSSAYQLLAGMFRLVCSNGLIIADRTIGSVRVAHSGDVVKAVVAGAESVIDQTEKVTKVQRKWIGMPMTERQQLDFADQARAIRWRREEDEDQAIEPEQLLIRRRDEDKKSDLWTVFNVIQENAIRGGLKGHTADKVENGIMTRGRRLTSREIKSIDKSVQINRDLWELAEKTADALKVAA